MTDMKSQWQRTRHTFIRPLLIGLPLSYSLLMALYFSLCSQNFTFSQALQGFSTLLVVATEFIAGLMIVQIVRSEQKAGNFANELRIGIARSQIIVSRLLFLACLLVWVFISADSTFLVLLTATGSRIDFAQNLHFMIWSFLTLLPFLPVDLFLAYKSGLTGVMLANTAFCLSGILLGTTDLGMGIWQYLPWVWPIRLAYRTDQNAAKFCLLALFLMVFLTLLLIFWYNRWEVQSREE